MSEQSVCGRHYLSGKFIEVKWADGKIHSVADAPEVDPDRWLAPGLVDIQINGYAGVDFQQDEVTDSAVEAAAAGLRRDGCGRWFLTLITDEWSVLLKRLLGMKQARDRSATLRRQIAGWHIEGPFLSPEPGYRGAHNPAVMTDPSCAQIDELKAVVGDDPTMLTLAAERNGTIDAIRRATGLGIKVSVGHSDASTDQLRAAVAAGATGFTHLGNGMPQAMDRFDNIVGRVIDTDGLVVGLIPDGLHLAPQLFRLIHKAQPADQIYYTTDAMSAAGAPPGRYRIGKSEVEVGEDQVVRIPGQTNFAGSALKPIEGVRRAANMLGRSWRDVWDFFSLNPAGLVGLSAGIEVGATADLCLVEGDRDSLESVRWLGDE
jgi:N-acetylglucosamine-6-phosphate deacetylase